MQLNSTTFGSHFAQVAWVVPDIHLAEKFFIDVFGIPKFVKLENLRSEEHGGTYSGSNENYVFHLYMAYSGDTLLEIIQPIAGKSIYTDYLDEHPEGGVQHIAFMVRDTELDECITQWKAKGYPVIQSLQLPVANVAYFDTTKEIGVMTEVIGLTAEGVGFLDSLKTGNF